MHPFTRFRQSIALAAAVVAAAGLAQASAQHPNIPWLNDWGAAKAEALRLNKPILFVFGAPRCGGVPGVW